MITKITAKHFKGFQVDQEIGPKTLFVGPNGSGKSVHSLAMQLAILGHIPGVAKKNDQILETFGSEDFLNVGVEIGKTSFMRQFREHKGSVQQKYMVNFKAATARAYASALGANGDPKILDLGTVLAMSDAKMIDLLFLLFPPAGDVGKLDAEIEKAKAEESQISSGISADEATMKRLAKSRSEMQLPPGNLAGTTAEIERVDAELKLARKALKDAQIKAAEEKAKAQAEAEAAEKAARAKAEAKAAQAQQEEPKAPAQTPEEEPEYSHDARAFTVAPASIGMSPDRLTATLKKIDETAERAGCAGVCALVLVAKREIRQLIGGTHGH